MPEVEFTCELEAPLERVWQFHNAVELLLELTPPDTQVTLEGDVEPMDAGVVYVLRIRRSGITLRWETRIVEYDPPNGFTDRQVAGKGPFAYWQHQHQFTALSPTRTRLVDHVTYVVPFGVLGSIVDALFVRREINKLFAFRHQVTRAELER